MAAAPVLFFRLEPDSIDLDARLAPLRARQPGVDVGWWRPALSRPFAPGRFSPLLWTYSGLHAAHLFATRDYGAVMLRGRGGVLDHLSFVFPRFARFPFMKRGDLQIGATWTRPEARGQSLATRAIYEIVARTREPGRAYWYLTEAANVASVRAVEKAGFTLAGEGEKLPRMGLKFFGYYAISRPRDAADRPDGSPETR